ncbi:MAG: hypothetical protein A3D92_08300 [Bacteroidetes bacterium RIFCSPHIGHO2_02_FULL_44_7]|uniref:Diacylglycerol kinase n=1 Tax=Candidatus Nomurabacteria bacterium RIFCSPLOWO2_01_FULL_46_18 TaxID=1801783 RepID=A0A1F6XCP1_9BACT|nr:MAG: hypothetical protein A3D92_08300 [Bacteroidetes bacterium RIFCSPHIGHO2_02_FULL_44_7]OGI91711.1 MAG: hypothetical protein A2933_01690 [Candidatus Nomurabacteria bacterium RIFCSPLOWO2_01_FULL_46_18]
MGRNAKEKFSLIARLKSVNHAWRGLGILIKTTHNLWGHLFFAALAIYLGIILDISANEWLFIILAIGLVIITEALNSAFEIDIDLTSPEEHPYARDTKDISSAAVFISVWMAMVIGIIIFVPKIFNFW